MPTIAIVSTSFGFGPVSKAIMVATEFQAVGFDVDFFGNGIALDFARRAFIFRRIVDLPVDTYEGLFKAVPLMADSDAVVSVMNFITLELAELLPPIFIVDSLSWMWPENPDKHNRAAGYYAQDYLLDNQQGSWLDNTNITRVGPIRQLYKYKGPSVRQDNLVVVNISGAASPMLPVTFFSLYTQTICWLVSESFLDMRVVFCGNQAVNDWLKKPLAEHPYFEASHLDHNKFVELIAQASLLLTTPGITTTLEAVELNTPIVFLPPQNYSQAIMNEIYSQLQGNLACLSLSRFGDGYQVPMGLPESKGVLATKKSIEALFSAPRKILPAFKAAINNAGALNHSLRTLIRQPEAIGQEQIVQSIVRELV